MADFVNTSTLAVELSCNDKPVGWVTLPRADALAALEIPQQYRKWTGSAVEEMTQGEKDAVDAAAATAAASAKVASYELACPPGIWGRAVVKSASQSRTGTTTLADDSELLFPVVANGRYIFQARLFFDTTAAGDFKVGMNGPASPVGFRFRRQAIAPGATAWSGVGVSTAYGGGTGITGTGTTGGYCEIYGILANGANAGNVTIQWAQNTSDPGNATVLQGSMLWYARIA